MKREIFKLIGVMTAICILAASLLAFVFYWTKPTIQARKKEALFKALHEVAPPGVTKIELDKEYHQKDKYGNIEALYRGYSETGELINLTFVTSSTGFQGRIKIMVGLNLLKKAVACVKILEHLETPGLGAKITESDFLKQFKDKPFSDNFIANEDIDAISGATISSQAVAQGIKESLAKLKAIYPHLFN
jgi:electron transport complex protein RnfG